MDPYETLGVAPDATRDEIRQAYRREAMKWHPDRCNNENEARERFHRAAEAYRTLSQRGQGKGGDGADPGASDSYRYESTDYGPADHDADAQPGHDETGDKFADSIFWDVMLDYAIKLAQTGLSEAEIELKICRNGCPQRLAALIADKAFNIHAHYATSPGKKRRHGPDKSTFKEERHEADLLRAFLGQRNLFWSPRDSIEYYLVVFGELRQSAKLNPLSWISVNRRLARILNFSIILFAVMAAAIHFFPGPSKYKLLPDILLLQLPLGVLALMLVWGVYRKMWLFTLGFGLVFLATLAFFNTEMPGALYGGIATMLPIAVICFAPFLLIALFGNFFYYRSAQTMIGAANRLFDEHIDRLVWIKNRAGTSTMGAFVFMLAMYGSLYYLATWNGDFADSFEFDLPGIDIVRKNADEEKIRFRLEQAGRFFEIAESHFNDTPPDYLKAEMAYSTAAANGSLLAAYKLGYMYYAGEGVARDDRLALAYFERAVKAPLAFQPHSLQLTTRYLAEAYNNLGILYQNGFGTRKNLKTAQDMFRQGAEFGSANAKLNLAGVYGSGAGSERKPLLAPDYR